MGYSGYSEYKATDKGVMDPKLWYAYGDEIHLVNSSDGGLIYVEVRGTGRPDR